MESCKKCLSSIVQYVTWVWKNYFSLVLSSPGLITSPPMLERLDWVFDSPYWIIIFQGSEVPSLSWEGSNHVPYVVNVSSKTAKSTILRFENYWLKHDHFESVLREGWQCSTSGDDPTKRITTKFKNLRAKIRHSQRSINSLASLIFTKKPVL